MWKDSKSGTKCGLQKFILFCPEDLRWEEFHLKIMSYSGKKFPTIHLINFNVIII